ncbi:MAG: protein kinase [Deltaproteobacteria bacterium]|nr:protein kinase [Deltaproteobacteria bacterium]
MRVCPQCGLKYSNDQPSCFVDGSALEEAPDPYIGLTLAGRYLVESTLGEGGMAVVYRARHTLVDRPVAVKIMNKQLASDASLRERFRREAKNAAALAHPNIIEIYDYGETDDGAPFLVMELLDGAPLADYITERGMPPGEVASLGMQIAQGLARAHDFDVIHRDLKPDNIFVSRGPHGRPLIKLLDFGIARSMQDSRLTNVGEVFGTPQYMAPERITSIDAGPAADLYALGVIYFEMLTGRLPFEAEEITGYFIKHMQEVPPKPSDLAPDCPRRLEELILELLAKSPDERPVDAHQVVKELASLVPKEGPGVAPPVPTPSRPVVAPTLPPTTLERWARRTAIFDQMLSRAYPAGDAPAPLRALLESIRGTLTQIHSLRHEGLKEQRQLEQVQNDARDQRARLGFAVQSLAEDLSQARDAARRAKAEVAPYFEADDQGRAAYLTAHQTLESAGGYHEVEEPTEALVRALREVTEGLDRWLLARGAAEKARRWVDAKEEAVRDVEFQVGALRQQLERSEGEFDTKKAQSEAILVSKGAEVSAHEQQLVEKATQLANQLRSRRELSDLFAQLEAEGA